MAPEPEIEELPKRIRKKQYGATGPFKTVEEMREWMNKGEW